MILRVVSQASGSQLSSGYTYNNALALGAKEQESGLRAGASRRPCSIERMRGHLSPIKQALHNQIRSPNDSDRSDCGHDRFAHRASTACHRRIEQRLETLIRAAGHIEHDRRSALDAIAKSLQFMDTSGVLHTEDEEASLFPRLRRKLSAGGIAFLDSLEAQHHEAESIYAELKEMAVELERSSAVSAESIARYRGCAERLQALYGAHIRAEDEVLTAMARRSLDEADTVQISREMRERRASRSGSPPREG